MAAPQSGKQNLLLPGEALRVLHWPLIHLAQPFMLCWPVHFPPFDRELGGPKGHRGILRDNSTPALPSHLPSHLVSSLITRETAMTRDPLEEDLAGQGAKLFPQAPQDGVVIQLTPLKGCQGRLAVRADQKPAY